MLAMAAEHVERIGARIRECREGQGLTRRQLVMRMEGRVSENDLYRWERGQHRPNDNTLQDIAKALEVDVSYFLAPAPEPGTADLLGALKGDERRDPVRRELAAINAKLDILLQRDGLALADLTEEITRYFEETLGKRSEAESADQPTGRHSDARAASGRSRSQGTRRTA